MSENSISDQTKILMVNAAYFVGKWMKKFPESETKECPFRVNKVCAARSRKWVSNPGSRAGLRDSWRGCEDFLKSRREKEGKEAKKPR